MRVKEKSEKAGLNTQHSGNLDHGIWCHHFRENIDRRGKSESSDRFYSWAPKSLWMVTAAIKLRHLLLGRKSMTNLDRVLQSRDITLSTKFSIVWVMVFPEVKYGCESWTIEKAECQRNDDFEMWCWRRLLRVPWTARRSNQLISKEINPEYSLEGLLLKLKLQYFGHLLQRDDPLEKTHAKKGWRQKQTGAAENDMIR